MPTQPYYVDGRRVPSVTTLIRWAGHYVPDYERWVQPAALATTQDEGEYFHEMCQMEMHGTLDEPAVPEAYRGILEAWQSFRYRTNFVAELSLCEQPVVSNLYRYGGTPDWVGRCPAGATNWWPAVVELKRTISKPAAALQTMGYALALPASHYRRFALRCDAKGKPHIEEFIDYQQDRAAFLACVTLGHDKLARGLVRITEGD